MNLFVGVACDEVLSKAIKVTKSGSSRSRQSIYWEFSTRRQIWWPVRNRASFTSCRGPWASSPSNTSFTVSSFGIILFRTFSPFCILVGFLGRNFSPLFFSRDSYVWTLSIKFIPMYRKLCERTTGYKQALKVQCGILTSAAPPFFFRGLARGMCFLHCCICCFLYGNGIEGISEASFETVWSVLTGVHAEICRQTRQKSAKSNREP